MTSAVVGPVKKLEEVDPEIGNDEPKRKSMVAFPRWATIFVTFVLVLAAGMCVFEVINFKLLMSLVEVKTKAADPQDEGNIGIIFSDQIDGDDDEDAQPPAPNDEDLEYLDTDNSTSEDDRRLASTDLHEGVPYIIKNGDLELSWFGGWWDGTYVKNYIYPVYAHQHTNAEKMWLLKKVRGNTYTVKMHPDNRVSACWHLGWNSLIDRRMSAELKCSTGFPWEFRREWGQKHRYRIINQHAHYRGAQLYRHYNHVLIRHTPSNLRQYSVWDVRPGFSVRGYWEREQSLPSSTDGSPHVKYENAWGRQQTTAWSETKEFARTVTATVSASMEVSGTYKAVTGTASASYSLTESQRQSVTQVVSGSVSTSYSKKKTISIKLTKQFRTIWRFKVEVTNHQNGGNAKAVSASPDIEVTAGTHSPPRCLPGYCVPDTGCQQCEKDGWIGGAPRSCNVVNKKRYERHCDFWARRGHCKDRFRRFMNYWCPKSCQC